MFPSYPYTRLVHHVIAAALPHLPCSGFTAKAAGTEAGVGQPEPTFSPCFTSTSLVWHPVSFCIQL